MSDHYAVKAAIRLLHSPISEVVEADPAATPLAIARGLVSRMTSDECRVILEQLCPNLCRFP